jgi:hypothetical protein
MGDYTEFGNILNLAIAAKDERDQYVVIAAWLETHDNLIRELLSSPDMFITPRKRYSTTGRSGSVHFVAADDGGRIFVCITKEKYPSRVAHMCLEEMQDHVLLSPHNNASLTATKSHQLSDALLPILDDLVDKFDDPSQADALTSVNRKIDVTTNTMQENISLLLENDSKLQEIEGKADNMNTASEKFKNSSTDLRKKMWWKMCKMRICYALVVICILLVIVIPITMYSGKGSEASSTTNTVYIEGGYHDDDDDDDAYRASTRSPEKHRRRHKGPHFF